MFDTFSIEARQILFLARFEASRLRFDSVEPQHLALGFVIQDQGGYPAYLSRVFEQSQAPIITSDMEREPGKSFLDAAIAPQRMDELSWRGSRADSEEPSGDMPLSAEAQAALEVAIERANGETVTALHILLGILSNESEHSSECLLRHGISREQVEQAIRSAASPASGQ